MLTDSAICLYRSRREAIFSIAPATGLLILAQNQQNPSGYSLHRTQLLCTTKQSLDIYITRASMSFGIRVPVGLLYLLQHLSTKDSGNSGLLSWFLCRVHAFATKYPTVSSRKSGSSSSCAVRRRLICYIGID